MGTLNVQQEFDDRNMRDFTQALLADLRALAFMLEDGRIESRVRRIGAEQEMFLVDRHMRPAPLALEVLSRANDPRLTTEIALFNLEANLTPTDLTGHCFQQMQAELTDVITKATAAASEVG